MACCKSDQRNAPEQVAAELSVSAKLVYKVLEYEGPLTQQELVAETRLVPRTVRHALSQLKDAGVIEERVYLPDARQLVYSLSADRTLEDGGDEGDRS